MVGGYKSPVTPKSRNFKYIFFFLETMNLELTNKPEIYFVYVILFNTRIMINYIYSWFQLVEKCHFELITVVFQLLTIFQLLTKFVDFDQ